MSVRFNTSRRRFTAGLAAVAVAPYVTKRAYAAYPDGPISIAVAYAAGGGTDALARLLAPLLSERIGQPVTVQNLPGGGGQVAATTLLRDGMDGHMILATNEPDLSISTVFSKPPYGISDFQVIMVDMVDPRVMLVQDTSGIGSFADFVARARQEPGKLAVSAAQGGAQELFAKWLFGQLGLDVRLVGYDGGGAAANAMLAGDVIAAIGDDFARLNIRDKSRALLVGARTKSPRWPEAPTLTDVLAAEGIAPPTPDFLARHGVYVVPAAFKAQNSKEYAKLQMALLQAREAPEYKDYIAKTKVEDLSIGAPGEDFASMFANDLSAVSALAK